MSVIGYIKENPITIVGIIGAGIVLYLLFNSGGGTTVVQQGGGPVDHTLDIAQMQLTAQTQQLQYQLAETQANNSAQIAIATLQAQLGTLQTAAGRDVSLAGIQAQQNVQLAGIQSQVLLAGLQEQTNQAQIAATRDLGFATAATYAHIADVQAATTIASYNAQVAMAQSSNQTTVDIAKITASTQKRGQTLGLFGSIASGVLGLFSDERTKVDVQTLGYDEKGRRWVSYRYYWEPSDVRHAGVMAQELLETDPQAVHSDPLGSGYLRVDYEALSA